MNFKSKNQSFPIKVSGQKVGSLTISTSQELICQSLDCTGKNYNSKSAILLKSRINVFKNGSHLRTFCKEKSNRSKWILLGKDYNIKLILLLTSRTTSKDQSWVFLLQLYAKLLQSQSLLSFVEDFSVECDRIVLRTKLR